MLFVTLNFLKMCLTRQTEYVHFESYHCTTNKSNIHIFVNYYRKKQTLMVKTRNSSSKATRTATFIFIVYVWLS